MLACDCWVMLVEDSDCDALCLALWLCLWWSGTDLPFPETFPGRVHGFQLSSLRSWSWPSLCRLSAKPLTVLTVLTVVSKWCRWQEMTRDDLKSTENTQMTWVERCWKLRVFFVVFFICGCNEMQWASQGLACLAGCFCGFSQLRRWLQRRSVRVSKLQSSGQLWCIFVA